MAWQCKRAYLVRKGFGISKKAGRGSSCLPIAVFTRGSIKLRAIFQHSNFELPHRVCSSGKFELESHRATNSHTGLRLMQSCVVSCFNCRMIPDNGITAPDASPHMLGLLGEGLLHFVKADCTYFAKCKFSEI